MKKVLRRMWYGLANRLAIWHLRRAGNRIEIDPADIWRVKFKRQGATGCVVRVGKLASGSGMVDIRLCCSDSEVEIGGGLHVSRNLSIFIGGLCRPSHVAVRIGEGCSFERCKIFALNSGSSVQIGGHCMFAYEILLHHTDVHPVYDGATHHLVNRVGRLVIGSHVWVGAHVTILMNVEIPDGCIIGWGSVVTGRFDRPNVVIAGNPAIIRTPDGKSIAWAASDPAYYANEGACHVSS